MLSSQPPGDPVSGIHLVAHSPTVPVAIILLIIAYVSIGLRLWTRVRIVRRLGLDDVVMILTLLLYTFFAGATIKVAYLVRTPGFKQFVFSHVVDSVVWLLVAELLYIATVLVLKLALGIFFSRIMIRKWQLYIIRAAMIVSTIFGAAFFFFALFQCGSFKLGTTFVLRKVSGQCVSKRIVLGMSYAHAIIVSTTDLLFALLPIFLLKESQMKRKEKAVVGIILSLGTIGGVCSLVRLRYIPTLSASNTLKFFGDSEGLAVWSLLEPGIGITAACLATTRPLFRSFSHRPNVADSGQQLTKTPKQDDTATDGAETLSHNAKPSYSSRKTNSTSKLPADLELGYILKTQQVRQNLFSGTYTEQWVWEQSSRLQSTDNLHAPAKPK